jgi:uncharacterized membrane protein
LPSLLVFGAVLLSVIALLLDEWLGTAYARAWWLFGGNAEGARSILSVIAGSLVSVIALSFSVTMIAIQQASTQYTPRILKNFTRDRGNQLVLGTYVATFTYALLILRRVREGGENGDTFVPAISISVGMLLSLVSFSLLVYFIHHVAESLQVETLLNQIRRELDRELDRLYPESLGRGIDDAPGFDAELAKYRAARGGCEVCVRADTDGYLRHVRAERIAELSRGFAPFVVVGVCVGQFVREGDVLLRAWSEREPDESFAGEVLGAFHVDRDRSVYQDPSFGIQQLVDIAVKALSPGINDPTTAVQAIDNLGAVAKRLAGREIPSPLRTLDGTRLLVKRPEFRDYVESAFSEVRRAARSNLRVSSYLLELLEQLADATESPARAEAFRREHAEIGAGFDIGSLTHRESEQLARLAGASASLLGRP